MLLRTTSLLAFVIYLALLSACAILGSSKERAASITKLGAGSPSRDFLAQRSAILVTGEKLSPIRILPGQQKFSLEGHFSGIGSATAVDERGYFLTSAHCVGKDKTFVVFRRKDGIRLEPARVVWRAKVENGDIDLAIIHVPTRLDFFFDWGNEPARGLVVYGIGLDNAGVGKPILGFFAGRVSGTSRQTNVPHYSDVFSTAPTHPGDSGGPLVGSDGKLYAVTRGGVGVGVSPRFAVRLPFMARAVACRPDLVWLSGVINEDFANQHEM